MHQSQVQAYREAAVKALRAWAQTEAPLAAMNDNDTQDAFVERCVMATLQQSWPNWQLDSAKMVVVIEIRKRARTTFAKYNSSTQMSVDPPAASPVKKEEKGEETEEKQNGAAPVTSPQIETSNVTDDDDDEDDDDGEADGEMDDSPGSYHGHKFPTI